MSVVKKFLLCSTMTTGDRKVKMNITTALGRGYNYKAVKSELTVYITQKLVNVTLYGRKVVMIHITILRFNI
jgi:hypothetical protein